MNALNLFKGKANLPVTFGEARPYVRLAYVDESETTGADADVEFDGESGRVTVTVTEWEKIGKETVRNPEIRRVSFDLETGTVIGGDEDGERLSSLLIAVDGMKVLGEGA